MLFTEAGNLMLNSTKSSYSSKCSGKSIGIAITWRDFGVSYTGLTNFKENSRLRKNLRRQLTI